MQNQFFTSLNYNFIAFRSKKYRRPNENGYKERCYWNQEEHTLLSRLLLQFGYSPTKIQKYMTHRTRQQIISHLQKLRVQTSQMDISQMEYSIQAETITVLEINDPGKKQRSNKHSVRYNKIRNAGFDDGIALYLVGGKSQGEMIEAINDIFE